MVQDVAFEVGRYGRVFLSGLGARAGCRAPVEDVYCCGGVLGDVVGFHCALQGHIVPVYFVDCYADWPVVVRRIGSFGVCHCRARRWWNLM